MAKRSNLGLEAWAELNNICQLRTKETKIDPYIHTYIIHRQTYSYIVIHIHKTSYIVINSHTKSLIGIHSLTQSYKAKCTLLIYQSENL